MRLPKPVVLVGGTATATPEPDSELTARLTATAPCFGAVVPEGTAELSGFLP